MTPSSRTRQARRLFIASTLSALLLAGCGGGRGLDLPPRGPQVPGKNQVALLVPLTGEDAAVGQSIANAARMALADTNAQSVQLAIYNTATGGAAAAASQAIASGNRLILGPLLSDQVRAVAPIARRARVPVIAYSNDEMAAGDGVYILGFVPGQAVDRVVRHARAVGTVRFGAIAPDDVYGQRATQALLFSAQAAGGQVVGVEKYANAEGARAALRRLNARGPYDALLVADGGRVAAAVAPQLRAGVRVLGTDLWAGERNLGRTARLRGAWYAAAPDATFQQFVSRYRARYNATPGRLASLGYDSMLLTVRAARNWTPGRRFPLSALDEREGFVGVDGVFRFTRSGVAQRGLEVRQVTASGSSVLSPAPASF